MYMKKTADIFAEEKAYLLDKKYIDDLERNYHLRSLNERTVKTSCGCMVLHLMTVGCWHDDPHYYRSHEYEKPFPEEDLSACNTYIKAFFDAADFHYYVASKFPATEAGFESACHWLDNKREMLMERITEWVDTPKIVREYSTTGKESVISVTKSSTLSNSI